VAKSAGVPLIGMGGMASWQDAAEFILAGASGVGIGTMLFTEPATPNRIVDGLCEWLSKMKVERLSELIGTLELPGDEPRQAPYP
jgi:dihydroorotate dehydrogenase (NAD+) catalytic subunit